MKTPLDIGDRVRAYVDARSMIIGTINNRSNLQANIVWITATDAVYGPYHPKQCRRLMKDERREIWVDKETVTAHRYTAQGMSDWRVYFGDPEDKNELVRFVEAGREKNK